MSDHGDIRVRLAGSLDFGNPPFWMAQFHECISAAERGERLRVVVDMSGITFVSAMNAAVLAAILIWLRERGALEDAALVVPQSSDVRDWLNRMDFFSLLELSVPYHWAKRDATGRFREIVQVDSERQTSEVADELGKILTAQTSLPQPAISAVQTVWAELLENVFHHAASPIGATFCAQTYPKLGLVEFGVVDSAEPLSTACPTTRPYATDFTQPNRPSRWHWSPG